MIDEGIKDGNTMAPKARNYEEMARLQRSNVAKLGRRVWKGDTPLKVRLNYGRWIVDCPCGNGAMAAPEWPLAICIECGGQHPVVWPEKKMKKEIERLVLRRKPGNRHWLPSESTDDLKSQNTAHGIADKG